MADLVKKKVVGLDLDTYARLSKLAANLRAANPEGGFVSMSAAVAALLDRWERVREEYEKGAILEPTQPDPENGSN